VYRLKVVDGYEGYTLLDGKYLLFRGRLGIPDIAFLRIRIIREAYNRLTTAYLGRNKTRQLVIAKYWWLGQVADVDRFVANYIAYRASKAPRDRAPGLL
jgi:hypothetical protein